MFEIKLEKGCSCIVLLCIFVSLFPILGGISFALSNSPSGTASLFFKLMIFVLLILFSLFLFLPTISFGVYPTHIYHYGKFLWNEIERIIIFHRLNVICIGLNHKHKMSFISKFATPRTSISTRRILINYTKMNKNNVIVTFVKKRQFDGAVNAVKYYAEVHKIPIIEPKEFM